MLGIGDVPLLELGNGELLPLEVGKGVEMAVVGIARVESEG